MWTPTTREQHSRKALRYRTDLTDAEWVVIEPHLPPAHGTGRPRSWPMREIVNGIFYVMRAGCPWRLLPSDLPPWGTIYRWFAKFRDDGLLEKINHSLVMADRERVGREASPSGAIIDSQSVKTTEAGGRGGADHHCGPVQPEADPGALLLAAGGKVGQQREGKNGAENGEADMRGAETLQQVG